MIAYLSLQQLWPFDLLSSFLKLFIILMYFYAYIVILLSDKIFIMKMAAIEWLTLKLSLFLALDN